MQNPGIIKESPFTFALHNLAVRSGEKYGGF
jgi:hypothetical protein